MHPDKYSLENSPIAEIWAKVEKGEINLEYALELAGHPDVASHLSPFYVEMVSHHALHTTNGKSAVNLQHILLHAVRECQEDAAYPEMLNLVVQRWIEVVARYLKEAPDGQLYTIAHQEGRDLLEQLDDEESKSEVSLRLGLLHLEPYRFVWSGISQLAPPVFWSEWFLREDGDGALHPENLFERARSRLEILPKPQEAFGIAIFYLEQAALTENRERRAFALSRLAQALHGFREVGGEVSINEISQYACQAVPHLTDSIEKATLIALLAKYDMAKAEGYASSFLAESLCDLPKAFPLDAWVEVFSILAAALPQFALRPIMHLREFTKAMFRGDYTRFNLLRDIADKKELTLLDCAVVVEELDDGKGDYERMAMLENQIGFVQMGYDIHPSAFNGPSGREGYSLLDLADELQDDFLGLLGLASLGLENDLVGLGRAIALFEQSVERSAQFAHSFDKDYFPVANYIGAKLYFSRAFSKTEAGDAHQAILDYFRALQFFLDLKLRPPVRVVLLLLVELVNKYQLNREAATEMAERLNEYAVAVELECGEAAAALIKILCQSVLKNILDSSIADAELCLLLFDVLKGLRYGTALSQIYGYQFPAEDGCLKTLESEISSLQKQLQQGEGGGGKQEEHASAREMRGIWLAGPEGVAELDEELLAHPYTRAGLLAGRTIVERLENLHAQYDFEVERKLLTFCQPNDRIQVPGAIQGELDDRTILVNFFLDEGEGNSFTLFRHFFTRENSWMTYGPYVVKQTFGKGFAALGGPGISPLNKAVSSFRARLINDDPEHLSSSSEVGRYLGLNDTPFFSNEDMARLEMLFQKQKKDHLCIVPHGPLHFFPMHLWGIAGQPLADKWIITYLPNLHMLKLGRNAYAGLQYALERKEAGNDAPTQPTHSLYRPGNKAITTLGINYEKSNPHLLPPLPNAVHEAQVIAGLYHTSAVIEPAVTKAAFVHALEHSRMVHIASHGSHRVRQPSFQCLFLCPDADSDGILYAHELLGIDARRLDLLTLSACETGLGRYDMGDNLLGLPAFLFMAGVSTIISTLWKVDTHAAEYFFTALYQQLALPGSNKLDAFRYAQQSTRQKFKQYRHWGAFYYSGSWY